MTRQTLELLKDRLTKELNDVIEYDKLFNIIEDNDFKDIIEHIAKEEYHHAFIIQNVLNDMNVILDDSYAELWKKVNTIFELN